MPAPVRLDPAACPPPGAQASVAKAFADPSGAFSAGIWRSEPKRFPVAYAKDELCVLIEGEVRLTGEDGATQVFRAGDAFVVPAGFKGVWEMPVAVTKFYALHTPKAG